MAGHGFAGGFWFYSLWARIFYFYICHKGRFHIGRQVLKYRLIAADVSSLFPPAKPQNLLLRSNLVGLIFSISNVKVRKSNKMQIDLRNIDIHGVITSNRIDDRWAQIFVNTFVMSITLSNSSLFRWNEKKKKNTHNISNANCDTAVATRNKMLYTLLWRCIFAHFNIFCEQSDSGVLTVISFFFMWKKNILSLQANMQILVLWTQRQITFNLSKQIDEIWNRNH